MEFHEVFLAFILLAAGGYFLYQKSRAAGPVKPISADNGKTDKAATNALPMSIFFGSQSGTAETFANELSAEAAMYGFKPKVVDMEDYDREELKDEKYAVFLVATFGEGEPTDNSAEFLAWLNDEARDSEELKGMPFSVFALGNRQYEHFCKVGRDLDTRLAELGGHRVVDHGEGDDDGSLEDDFANWKKIFWAATNVQFGTKAGDAIKGAENKKFESSFSIINLNSSESRAYNGGLLNLVTDPKHRVVKAKCVENYELRQAPERFGSTKHIEFDLSGLKLAYATADNLGVYPKNDEALVNEILSVLALDGSALFKAKAKAGKKSPFPSPCSIFDAFCWYLDFQSSPRLPQLLVLSQFCSSQESRDLLHHWAQVAKEEYVAEHKSWLEIFKEIPDCRPGLAELLDLIPKLAPRYYTISSSSLVAPTLCSITVSLMAHQKPRDRVTLGICSSYLCDLKPKQDLAAVFIRPSTFRLPKAKGEVAAPPVIMCGPGTGIAPFRGFIQEARFLREKGQPIGALTLYFGCREASKDFIYKSELDSAVSDGILNNLHLAFSRDPKAKEKVYVQHLMKQHGPQLWNLVNNEKAVIFLCGGTSMGRAVRETIIKLAKEHGQLTDKAAEDFLKKMQADKKFIAELWS